MCFVAPVCFNTSYCGEELVGDNSISYYQCCFELSGVSFALPGECLLCPNTGNLKHTQWKLIYTQGIISFKIFDAL